MAKKKHTRQARQRSTKRPRKWTPSPADRAAAAVIFSPLLQKVHEFQNDLRHRFPRLYEFDNKLRDLESVYGIPRKEVEKILFPTGDIFSMLGDAFDLRWVEERRRLYEQAHGLMEKHYPYIDSHSPENEEAERLSALIATVTKRRDELMAKVEEYKLGPGQRWGVPPDDFWEMTPGEAAGQDWKWRNPRQWGWPGDRAAALAKYLAPKIPSRRRPWRGGSYNKTVLELTAELMTLAYRLHFPAFSFSAQDVKTRIEARRRGRSST